jgi:hypothetical protein
LLVEKFAHDFNYEKEDKNWFLIRINI